jgi:hypothetical protein
MLVAEVKMNPRHLDAKVLEKKALALIRSCPGYKAEFAGLSIGDL